MKRTLITSALIAALAAPAVMAQDTAEQTSDYTIGLKSGYASGDGNYNGWTMALTDSFLDATETNLGTLSSVVLDSVTINNRTSGDQTSGSVYLAVYLYSEDYTTGTFVGVSDNVATNGNVNGSNTFTFTDVTLVPNEQYQYLFVTSNDTTTLATFEGYKSVAHQFGLNVANITGGTLPTGDGTYKGNGLDTWESSYMPNVSVAVSVTPEPTTATLSLLALAGLCARRRRK